MFSLFFSTAALAQSSLEAEWEVFRALEQDAQAFTEVTFTDNDVESASMLIEQKPSELHQLKVRGIALVEVGDPALSCATLTLTGKLYLDYADLLSAAPAPPGLDNRQMRLYQALLAERSVPVVEEGIHQLSDCVSLAEEAGISTVWSQESTTLIAAHTTPEQRRRGWRRR